MEHKEQLLNLLVDVAELTKQSETALDVLDLRQSRAFLQQAIDKVYNAKHLARQSLQQTAKLDEIIDSLEKIRLDVEAGLLRAR